MSTFIEAAWILVNVCGLGAACYVWAGARADLGVATRRQSDVETLLYLHEVFRSQTFRVIVLVLFTAAGFVAVGTPVPRTPTVRTALSLLLLVGALSVTVDSIFAGVAKQRRMRRLHRPDNPTSRSDYR